MNSLRESVRSTDDEQKEADEEKLGLAAMFSDILGSTIDESENERSAVTRCKNDKSERNHGSVVSFCIDCATEYCQQCVDMHRLFEITSKHDLVPLSDIEPLELQNAKLVKEIPYCSEHRKHQLDYFCDTCTCVVCAHCCVENHSGHHHTKIEKAAHELKTRLAQVSLSAAEQISLLQSYADGLESTKLTMEVDILGAKMQVTTTADKICQRVRDYEQTLLSKIDSAAVEAGGRIGAAKKEIDLYQTAIQSLQSYAESMRAKKDHFGVLLYGSTLENQFEDQKKVSVPFVNWKSDVTKLTRKRVESRFGDISFQVRTTNHRNVKMCLGLSKIIKPTYRQANTYVAAMVCDTLNLYVIHAGDPNIWMYCTYREKFVGTLNIPGMTNATDMVVLPQYPTTVLVISDYAGKSLHKVKTSVDVTGVVIADHKFTGLGFAPCGIACCGDKRLVITDVTDGRIVIADEDGRVLKSVHTKAEFRYPTHAFPMSDQFLVSSRRGQRLALMDPNGCIHRKSMSIASNTTRSSLSPDYVAVDRNGRIFIVDFTRKVIDLYMDKI